MPADDSIEKSAIDNCVEHSVYEFELDQPDATDDDSAANYRTALKECLDGYTADSQNFLGYWLS